jgi:hypothetical protein
MLADDRIEKNRGWGRSTLPSRIDPAIVISTALM